MQESSPPRRQLDTASQPKPHSRTVAAESDSLNLRELVAVVRRNWWIVLAAALATGALAAWFAYTAPPRYKATGVIRLANNRQAMAGNLSSDNSQSAVGTYSDPLQSYIQVLTSRSIAGVVVDSEPALLRLRTSGLPVSMLRDVEITPEAPVDSIRLAFFTQEVTATSRGLTARARYGTPLQLPGLRFTIGSKPAVDDALVQVLSHEAAAEALTGALKATQRLESDVIDVAYTGTDPAATQTVVNTLIRVFVSSSAESANLRSSRRRSFIEQQLAQTDSLETSAQAELTAFRSREHMFSSRDKFTAAERDAIALDVQRSALLGDRDVARSLLTGIGSAQASERSSALRSLVSTPGISSNPVVSQLYSQLVRFQSSRDSMTTGRFASSASNPDVQRLDTLIASSQNQLIAAVESQINSINAKITVLDQARARSSTSLDRLPSAAAEEQRLASQVESIRKIGDQLREEYQKAKIAEAVVAGEVEIVDFAGAPESLVGARNPKILIGLLVGIVLGVGAAFLREHMNTTIKRREDIERILRLSSVGVIPSFEKRRSRGKGGKARNGSGAHRNGVGASNGKSSAKSNGTAPRLSSKDAFRASLGLEAFASLRTNMLFQQESAGLKTLVVTSCAPQDGKSTVSSNLAKAFARFGTSVLLIDCDLRRPQLHNTFGVHSEPGLSDVLNGTVPLENALQPVDGHSSLFLLTAGARVENPSELIGGDRMNELLESLMSRFALVVLDSPPVLVVSDAAILSTRSDGVLFVVRAGTTEPDVARAALGQLDAVGAKVLGAVLNDPDNTLPRYDGGYYYKYYNDYFAKANA